MEPNDEHFPTPDEEDVEEPTEYVGQESTNQVQDPEVEEENANGDDAS